MVSPKKLDPDIGTICGFACFRTCDFGDKSATLYLDGFQRDFFGYCTPLKTHILGPQKLLGLYQFSGGGGHAQ